jgi:O-antigen ligase
MLALIGIALVGTFSRGATLAAVVAMIVFALHARSSVAALFRPAIGVAVGSFGLVPAMLDVRLGGMIGVVGLAVALFVAVSGPAAERSRAGLFLLGAAMLGAVLAVGSASLSPIRERITLSSTDRARVWRETLARVPDHLAFGTGPGTYNLVAPKDGTLVRTRYAHNEYLQALSETGVAGAVAVVAAIGSFAIALARARPRDGQTVACIASCAAFAVHSGLDFLWRIPLLVAFIFVLVGAATAETGAPAANQNEGWIAKGGASPPGSRSV